MEQAEFDKLFPLCEGLQKLLALGARAELINTIIPTGRPFAIGTDEINLQLNTKFTPIEVFMAIGLLDGIETLGLGNDKKYYKKQQITR